MFFQISRLLMDDNTSGGSTDGTTDNDRGQDRGEANTDTTNTSVGDDGGKGDTVVASYTNPNNFTYNLFTAFPTDYDLSEMYTDEGNLQYTNIDSYLSQNFLSEADITSFNNQSFGSQSAYDTEKQSILDRGSRRELAGQELVKRFGDVNAYNALVDPFNAQVGEYATNLGQTADFLGSAGINDYLGFTDTGPSYSELYGMETTAAPSFSAPVFSGEDIDLSGYSFTPDVSTYDDTLPLQELFQSNQIGLNSLQGQYDVAYDSDTDYLRALGADIDQFNRTSEGADIYGTDILSGFQNNYDDMLYGFTNFDPNLDATQELFGDYQTRLNDVGTYMSESQGLYDFEEGRISDFGDQFNTDIFGLTEQISGYDISNLAGFDTSSTQIGDMLQQVLGFESPMDYDRSSQLQQLGVLDTSLGTLRDARTAEESQILSDRTQYRSMSDALTQGLDRTDMYSGADITGYQSDSDYLRNIIGGYDSLLDPVFGQVSGGLDASDARIADLISQRAEGIGGLQTDIYGARDAGLSTDLWDQAGMEKYLSSIEGFQSKLGRYTGNTGSGLKAAGYAGEDSIDDIMARLDELGVYRTGIESDAASLFKDIDPNKLYGSADVDAWRDQLSPIESEYDLYNAKAAVNEIFDINQLLDTADTNIATGQQQTQDRDEMEAERQIAESADGFDVDYVNAQLASGDLSTEEYMALLNKVRDYDPAMANSIEQQYNALYT